MKLPSWPIVKRIILDILFPHVCLACENFLNTATEQDTGLCAPCSGQIFVHDTLFCFVCGARLPGNVKTCHKDAPLLLAAAADYENPIVRALIFRLKYERLRFAAEPLKNILADYLIKTDYDFHDFTVIPVPLHASRQSQRGFNQAEILSEAAAKILAVPHLPLAIKRIHHKYAQAALKTREERAENLEGAFAAKAVDVAGKNILLVDDVRTTGATLLSAASTLKNSGARKIIGLVVAKR
jgi:ComF family protein